MDRRRTAALVAPLAWLALTAAPATAAEPCLTVVLCEEPPPGDTAPPPPDPAPPTTTTTAAPAPPPPSEPDAVAHLLRRMNEERAARGLPALQRRSDVDGVAQAWSGHLADQRELSHNDAFFTPESRARHDARALGENVAVNRSPEAAHLALMNSEHHRDNILDPRFTVVGVGAVHRDGSWWITQDFVQPRRAAAPARPLPAAAAATPAPTPPAPPAPPRARAVARTASAPAAAPVAAVVAATPAPAAARTTLRPEPAPTRPRVPGALAADVATPTPRTALFAAVAAAAGWVVLAATRRRIREATRVMPHSGHRVIPTRPRP